jgi:hypothetical protein
MPIGVRNDSVRTTMQCPPATPLRPSFSGELREAMQAASKHQGLSLVHHANGCGGRLGRARKGARDRRKDPARARQVSVYFAFLCEPSAGGVRNPSRLDKA